jgi:hypothetical protein
VLEIGEGLVRKGALRRARSNAGRNLSGSHDGNQCSPAAGLSAWV